MVRLQCRLLMTLHHTENQSPAEGNEHALEARLLLHSWPVVNYKRLSVKAVSYVCQEPISNGMPRTFAQVPFSNVIMTVIITCTHTPNVYPNVVTENATLRNKVESVFGLASSFWRLSP